MITYSKEVQKYLNKIDTNMYKKFDKAFAKIKNGEGEKLKDLDKRHSHTNYYRIKMEHYRIIFEKKGNDYIIQKIGTKNDMKFHICGCK